MSVPQYTYKTRNWKAYNKGLCQRGSLTLWLSDRVISEWKNISQQSKLVGEKHYSDLLIEVFLTLGLVFKQPYRQTTGLVESIMHLCQLRDLEIPHYSTLCRRKSGLNIQIPVSRSQHPIHLLVDSTGVKFHGDGEWIRKKHGLKSHRMWRKIHIGVDPKTQEIYVGELSDNGTHDSEMVETLLNDCPVEVDTVIGDGAYDNLKAREAIANKGAKAIIPPQRNAVFHLGNKPSLLKRNLDLCTIRELGRKKWKSKVGYHERSLVETAMFRFKKIIGNELRSKNFDKQNIEIKLGLRILNIFAKCGMPDTYRVS